MTFNKKHLIVLATLFILFMGIVGVYLLLSPRTPSEQQQPPSTETGNVRNEQILSVDPNPQIALSPNTKPVFTVVFADEISTTALAATLRERSLFADQTKDVQLITTVDTTKKQLRLTPKTPLLPNATYILTIVQKDSGRVLLRVEYQTETITPTPVTTNNPDLEPYLPYETDTYKLSYWAERNVYVFSFKYNASDSDDTQTQFTKAEQNALTFIRSKGIDPNSLVIEWNY